MERKKKIISLLLLVTLCLFSGCGTGNKNVSSAAKSETKQTVSKEATTEEDYIVPDDLKEQSQEQKADRKKKKEQTTEQNKEEKTDKKDTTQEEKNEKQTTSKKAKKKSSSKKQVVSSVTTEQSTQMDLSNTVKSTTTESTTEETVTADTVSLTIECKNLLDHMDQVKKNKRGLVPKNGMIYQNAEVSFTQGDTVFDVLQRETKAHKIPMEYTYTPGYKTNYIEGIYNLYEFDAGETSGWKYQVNGVVPNYGCSKYTLNKGDQIIWFYVLE